MLCHGYKKSTSITRIGGVMVSVGSSPGLVKPNTIKLVYVASPLSIKEKGHTKKRPGQPGAAREQPGAARVLEITLVVLEYCLNRIFVEIIICNCFK
jgi:hypothetical protein